MKIVFMGFKTQTKEVIIILISQTIDIRTLTVSSQLLFCLHTLDSFLAHLGRNYVYRACCSAQMTHKQSRLWAIKGTMAGTVFPRIVSSLE